MRNFDELLTKDRSFTVRGETFTFEDVAPEILSTFDVDKVIGKNGDADDTAVWRLMDAQVMLFLKETDQKRWKELRKREKEPVTIRQLTEIVKWLMEEQTGRPTEQPSPSEAGRGRTAASSKAG